MNRENLISSSVNFFINQHYLNVLYSYLIFLIFSWFLFWGTWAKFQFNFDERQTMLHIILCCRISFSAQSYIPYVKNPPIILKIEQNPAFLFKVVFIGMMIQIQFSSSSVANHTTQIHTEYAEIMWDLMYIYTSLQIKKLIK